MKDKDVKNHTCYFFDDTVNINNFDSNNTKIDWKSYKDILIYCIVYVAIKDSNYIKINSVNPLNLFFNKVKVFFKKINENKYLTLVPTNESI